MNIPHALLQRYKVLFVNRLYKNYYTALGTIKKSFSFIILFIFPFQIIYLCVVTRLHLTVACMKRWGLRASFLSADTNADAGQNT
ncbi:MAG: hypothetical protein BGP01_07315 [Paludibacter sp. 47-17]|nr:MAG: hypothetical protein BGP01_07315 [Paludibacter sp. 47-17]